MTILVTGAGGKLGGLVVEELLAGGVEPSAIIASSRDTARLSALADRGVDVRRADFSDAATLPAAFEGAQRVLLISTDAIGERHTLHGNAVSAAADAGVELLAYTSIPHADTAQSLLAVEHRDTESLIKASGLPFTFLRNSWYQENYTAQLATVLEHGLVGAAGDGRVSAAARADYAAAAAAVLTGDGHPEKVYELGGPSMTLPQIAAVFAAESGQDVAYQDLPEERLRAVYAAAGMPDQLATVLIDADRGLARGELLVESDDLERLLGRPATPFALAVQTALARAD